MHDEDPSENPIIHPWGIRLLRKRPKLFDIEAREEFLERLEHNMAERRRPEAIGDRISKIGIRSTEEAAQPVLRDQLADRARKENRKRLRRL